MHILIATPYLPWPLNAGGKVAQFSTLECLSKDHSFTIVCPVYSQKEAEGIRELEQHLSHVRVKAVPLYNTHVLPPIIYSRLRDFLRSGLHGIRQLYHHNDKPNLETLTQPPYYPFSPLPTSFITTLTEEMKRNVDLLQIEFAEMLSLAALEIPNIPKIFINHQTHWVYAKRHLAVHGFDPYSNYLAARIHAEEALFLSSLDNIVVFSEEDANEIGSVVDPGRIHISPFPIPGNNIAAPIETETIATKNFTFLGSEDHSPNRDAIEWLLLNIWPLIRASIPQAQLFITGNWSEAWCSTHQAEGVIYTGFVDNIAKVMQGAIQLVPIRIGSGIRTKILVAMAQGIPVVSTTIGMEGIKVHDLEHALIRDTEHDFALGAITLANDPILANRLANEALKFIKHNYSYEVVRKTRNKIYDAAMSPT